MRAGAYQDSSPVNRLLRGACANSSTRDVPGLNESILTHTMSLAIANSSVKILLTHRPPALW